MIHVRPTQGRPWPLVLSVPHAGLEIPPERPDLKNLRREVLLRDVDFEVPRFWETAARQLDIPMIVAGAHRYAIDLNRGDDQVDARSVEGHPTPEGTHPKGLFWLTTTRLEALLEKPMPMAAYRSLVENIWKPYREFLRTELEAARKKFGFAILIDCHSMPSKGTAYHVDGARARADIVPGDVSGSSCDPRLLAACVTAATQAGLSVAPNDPYKGGGITQSFGRPADNIHALQIEVNRRIYMNEEKFTLDGSGTAKIQSFARDFLDRALKLRLGS